jgi:23S rRNA (adenine2503-C2)-methyltransferase
MLGMTLADFAAARSTHPLAVRREYGRAIRRGEGLCLPEVTRREDEGGVIKFCLAAGRLGERMLETESVIIPMRNYHGSAWHTLCVSSQVGCRMACTFCETGRMGLLRNLSADEIVAQRLVAGRLMAQSDAVRLVRGSSSRRSEASLKQSSSDLAVSGHGGGRRAQPYFADGIRNVVFMGMGEPLDNFDNVVQAIRVLNDPAGLDIPLSQITLSTVGRIDGLRKLAALGWRNLRLAISLNAPNDELRNRLMPINKGMPLADLQRALLEYPIGPRGLFLLEYVLIKGVNDDLGHAEQIAAWCRPLRCVVNLIPYNPQRDAAYETPSESSVKQFSLRLRDKGVFVKRRLTRGRTLMGACGQLGNGS